MIRSSCVNCLAHLAALCEALGQTERIRTELEALCDSTLERLCELARDMSMEEYTRLDLLLGVRLVLQRRIKIADRQCHSGILEKGTGNFGYPPRHSPPRTWKGIAVLEGSNRRGIFRLLC